MIVERNMEKLFKILTNDDLDDYLLQDIIKKLVNYWLRSLFTNFLNREDCLQIWDLGLVLGFDFYIKTCVYFLKSYETSLKIRIKALKEKPHPEFLIKIAHEEVRKVLAKGISVQIQALIQECFSKKMRSTSREDFIESAKILEIKESRQVARINQCRKILIDQNFCLKEFKVFVNNIKKLNGGKVYREDFVRVLMIAHKDLSGVGDFLYNLLDADANGWISKDLICHLFAVFLNYWEDRIEQIFFCSKSEDLTVQDFIKIIQNTQKILDKRSDEFNVNEKVLIRNLKERYGEILSKQDVLFILRNDQVFKKLMEILIDEKIKVLSTADSFTEVNFHPDPPISPNGIPNSLLSPRPSESPLEGSTGTATPANAPESEVFADPSPPLPVFLIDIPAQSPPVHPSKLIPRKCFGCSSCTII